MNKLIVLCVAAIIIVSCNTPTKYDQEKITHFNEDCIKNVKDTTPRVTGIGGIFIKSDNPQKSRDWYVANLGFEMTKFGSVFESRNIKDPNETNYLVWNLFEKDDDYFSPSEAPFMINYRVCEIEKLVEQLKKNGVIIVDEIETYDYGKFIHILDIDGNKIELWEPEDR